MNTRTVKQFVTITDAVEFLRGDFQYCFNLFDTPNIDGDGSWFDGGEIEFTITYDHDAMIKAVLERTDKAISKEEADHHVKMEALKSRKAELLALPNGIPTPQGSSE